VLCVTPITHVALFAAFLIREIVFLLKMRKKHDARREAAEIGKLLQVCRDRPQSIDKIRSVVKARPETLKATNTQGSLPLHVACGHQASLEVVQYLAEQWPEGLTTKNVTGDIPLHFACSLEAPLAVVEYLVEKSPDSVEGANVNGCLPLHVACANRAPLAVIQSLVDQWPETVKASNTQGSLPLHIACGHKASLEVIQYLVEQWPEALEMKNVNGHLPLHFALSLEESLEVVKYLVRKSPESVKGENVNGCLPLHVACANTVPLKVVQCLVEKWPEAVKIADAWGKTPLDYAKSTSDGDPIPEVVSWLDEVAAWIAVSSPSEQLATLAASARSKQAPKHCWNKVPLTDKTALETRAELEAVIAKSEDAIKRGNSSIEDNAIASMMHKEEQLKQIKLADDARRKMDQIEFLLAAAVQIKVDHIELTLDQLELECCKEKKVPAAKGKELKNMLASEEKTSEECEEALKSGPHRVSATSA
jgi:ankyrin repeat protein